MDYKKYIESKQTITEHRALKELLRQFIAIRILFLSQGLTLMGSMKLLKRYTIKLIQLSGALMII